jgi:hypothetical protein
MHKRRTQFARRINRVASAVETRGVRATYGLHDRVLSSRTARRQLSKAPPHLDETQQRVLDQLRAEGYAVLPFAELLPDRWAELQEAGDRFVAETEDGLRREAAGEDGGLRRSTKSFLVRRLAWGATIAADDVQLRIALDPRMLDLANAYLGMWAKLEYVDMWHTPPAGEGERVSSQRWHRDFNDRLLLKAFVYLNDVDADAGPFEYVPRSFPGGELGDLWPWWPGYDGYPPDEEFARRMADVRVETFTGTRGTMILCNTAGFHRGGFATAKPRSLATWTYCSPAALAALSERNYRLATGPAASPDASPDAFAVV